MNLFKRLFKRKEVVTNKPKPTYRQLQLDNVNFDISEPPIDFAHIIGANNKMVLDEALGNYNTWVNEVASINANNSITQYTTYVTGRMSWQECGYLSTDTLISKAINVLTNEIFKEGGDWLFKDEEAEHQERFQKEWVRLKGDDIVRAGVIKALQFGTAYVYIDMLDSDKTNPLVTTIKETCRKDFLRSLTTIEPYLMAPVSVNTQSPLYDNYMKPQRWWLQGASSGIDYTRFIPITFFEVANMLKPMFNYAGLPLAYFMKSYVKTAESTRHSIADLVMRFRTNYIKTSPDKLNDAEDLKSRVMYMNSMANNFSTILMSEDEELVQITTPVRDLQDIQCNMYELVAASCGIPITKFLGLAPQGMNATGEYDMNNFYDTIAGYQRNIVKPIFDRIADIICHFSLGVNIKPEYVFKPINRLTLLERADLDSRNLDNIQKAIDTGLCVEEDVLRALKYDGVFNFKQVAQETKPDNKQDEYSELDSEDQQDNERLTELFKKANSESVENANENDSNNFSNSAVVGSDDD